MEREASEKMLKVIMVDAKELLRCLTKLLRKKENLEIFLKMYNEEFAGDFNKDERETFLMIVKNLLISEDFLKGSPLAGLKGNISGILDNIINGGYSKRNNIAKKIITYDE